MGNKENIYNNADEQRRKITIKINRVMFGLFVIFVALVGSMLFNYYTTQRLVKTAEKQALLLNQEKLKNDAPKYKTPTVIYNLTGTIEDLGNDFIVLKVKAPMDLGERAPELKGPEERKVAVGSMTKFNQIKLIPVPDTNRKKVEEIEVSLEKLKKGDYIEVIANQDIATAQSFQASLIKKLN